MRKVRDTAIVCLVFGFFLAFNAMTCSSVDECHRGGQPLAYCWSMHK